MVIAMSDLCATLIVDGQPIDLVDFSRPVWFFKDNPKGFRIVPTRDNVLADGVAAFVLGAFDGLGQSSKFPIDLSEVEQSVDLDDIRKVVYRLDTSDLELLVHTSTFGDFSEELGRFINPIKVTVVPEQ